MFSFLPLIAAAAPSPEVDPDLNLVPERVVYAARTEVDFDGVELDAHVVRPDCVLIPEPRRPGFTRLILLRSDFRDAIDATADGVR